jgi:hypothetical protein
MISGGMGEINKDYGRERRALVNRSDVIARSAATKQPSNDLAKPSRGCRVGLRPPRNDVAPLNELAPASDSSIPANPVYFLSAGQGVPWSMTVTGPMPL